MKKFLLFIITVIAAQKSWSQPFRTPVLTGDVVKDFTETEKMPGSLNRYYAVTWDAKNIYLGVTGDAPYIKTEPTTFFFDTDPMAPADGGTGSVNGFTYDGRNPQLPFSANVVVYFKDGYAEVRSSSAFTWSAATVITDSIKTGINDIEITVPWTLFLAPERPQAFNFFMFKQNGQTGPGVRTDAYMIKPGSTSTSNDYSANVNLIDSLKYFYQILNSDSAALNGANVFSIANNTLLPQKLLYFTGTETNGNWQLQWQVQDDINLAYFNIYAFDNGIANQLIGSVSVNQSGKYSLNLPLNTPLSKYYQLQAFDKNGQLSFTKVIQLITQKPIASQILVYPTLANNKLFVKSTNKAIIGFKIVNTNGKEVLQQTYKGSRIQPVRIIDISSLYNGTFWLQTIFEDQTTQATQFIKQ